MSAITWSDVLAIAPEASGIGATAQTFILAHVNTRLVVDMFDGEDGPTTRMARIYYAAHMGASIGTGGAGTGGQVTSESAGGLSRSYATTAGGEGALGLSTYGRHYLGLIENSFARVPFVI